MSVPAVSVLADLQALGIPYNENDEQSVKVLCPFHNDTTPSLTVFLDGGNYHCSVPSCGKKGSFQHLVAVKTGYTLHKVSEWLTSRRGILPADETKIVPITEVEKFHSRIKEAPSLIAELRKRAITDDDIRKYRLGYDGQRITIPVFDVEGNCINIRKYLPGAPSKEKMRNLKGHGKVTLYPCKQLEYTDIVITGGEMKAIAGARALNAHGYGCITATGGEGAWREEFGPLFAGKNVVLAMDIDEAGRRATNRVAMQLSPHAATIRDLILPLDIAQFPKGDMSDYLATNGDANLVSLVANAPVWVPLVRYGVDYDETEPPAEVTLTEAMQAEYTGKRIRFKGVVSAIGEAPYNIPNKTKVVCSRDQPYCAICPVRHSKDGEEFKVSREHPAILKMAGQGEREVRQALMAAVGVPAVCRMSDFQPTKYINAEDVRISPEFDITSRAYNRDMQPAVICQTNLVTNETYEFTGRLHPHPQTQISTLVISEATKSRNALADFQLNDPKQYEIFQPSEWTVEALHNKLKDLYTDLEANVTQIFKRQDMHLVVDLVYHSPLFIKFDNGRKIKGWAEALIVGDSGQGKSKVSESLMDFYGVGHRVDCKGASLAGLLGGVQQLGKKWYITWGVIPLHDGKLVILEEIKGMPKEVLTKLTDMRSSGRAEIHKIEKRSTYARTRLLMITNPADNSNMQTLPYGVMAAQKVVGTHEDLRRFDMVYCISSKAIASSELGELMKTRPVVKQVFTSELCRNLILWAWSREIAVFEEDAEIEALDASIRMSQKYVDEIPIVDRGTIRLKIARLAAALAARTFSTSEDYQTVLVRKCHVQYIEKFLDEHYNGDAMGYGAFSRSRIRNLSFARSTDFAQDVLQAVLNPDFLRLMRDAEEFNTEDMMIMSGLDRDNVIPLMTRLMNSGAIIRLGSRAWGKTEPFIEYLKELPPDAFDRKPVPPLPRNAEPPESFLEC